LKTIIFGLFALSLLGALVPAFAQEFKSVYNYNLDDVAFEICKAEYDIYENAASMHMGDPHKLMQWKQYTQCHDDAFLVLHETKYLCAEQIKKAKNTKIVNDSLEWYDRQMSESRMTHEFEKAIECHKQVYYEEIVKTTIIETPEHEIICGEDTIDIDGICQVEKQIEPQKKPKKSSDWFSWFWDWFS
jgi:hypothetical protein